MARSNTKALIKERIEEYIRLSDEIRYYKQELERLHSEIAKVSSLLFRDRPKEYIEDVLSVLADMMDEHAYDFGYDILATLIRKYYEDYDLFMEERKRHMSPERLAIFEGKIE
jgi:hypothetical protein